MAGKTPRRSRRSAAPERKTRRTRQRTVPASEVAALAGSRPFSLSDDAIEAALASGEQSGLLEDYFGPAQYAELRRLAQEAATRAVRGGDRVLILPGIMGSKLGYDSGRLFDDVLWIDPIDIAAGRLKELSLTHGRPGVSALGVLLFAYLTLKYRLRVAGHDAEFHPFDWRQSLPDLGKALAARIGAAGSQVHLVAHSMGGLVARAAFAHKPKDLGRVVMLGTPNYGSFSPIQAFRGTHSIVRKVAFIDLTQSEEDLARDVFGTFPGLVEMMPSPEKFATDYFSLASWPAGGVRPDQAMLTAGKKVQHDLPTGHDELYLIAGINRETVVDAAVQSDEFVYTTSLDGDGTVPLQSALIATAKRTYYIEEDHGNLPNNQVLAEAVDSILATGQTSVLPDQRPERRAMPLRSVPEAALRAPPYEGARGRPLSMRERRFLAEEFASPDRAPAVAAGLDGAVVAQPAKAPGAEPVLSERVVVGRRRQHRLDITLALGSITDAEAYAYVLGLFRNVAPSGAARLIDGMLDGAVDQMLARRMFNANVGEISILPTGRHALRADLIAFAGLGPFDGFREEVLEVVGENLVRTFVVTRVDEFATVLLGGSSGLVPVDALRRLLTGFLRGLQDTDREHRFRGITICETDEARYATLRQEMLRLAATPLFDGIEVTLREVKFPATTYAVPRAAQRPADQSVYLIVRQETRDDEARLEFSASVLTAGAKAAIYKGRIEVPRNKLDALLDKITTPAFSFDRLRDFGRDLGALVLPENVRSILERYAAHPLVVVHDAGASRIPWETLQFGDHAPAIGAGLSHRYESENLAIAKWLEERQQGPTLDVLLVVNPTEDLPGAAKEGERVRELFANLGPAVKIRQLTGREARKHEVLRCLASGEFDVVHYAGHAFFDPLDRSRSGILCFGNEVLSGVDLAGHGSLPSLVFFNACEAARVRKAKAPAKDELSIAARVQRTVSFAEAFLRGGIANYLGTYWPVGDDAALAFARAFYTRLLGGGSLGDALMEGRREVHRIESVDWADYILYGDPAFLLKQEARGRVGHGESAQPAGGQAPAPPS
jgi:pimeloyl-ACP methyl ester carboxylesterase